MNAAPVRPVGPSGDAVTGPAMPRTPRISCRGRPVSA